MAEPDYDLDDKINLIYDYVYNLNTSGCYNFDKVKLGEVSLDDIKYSINSDKHSTYMKDILNSKFKITSFDSDTNELLLKRYSDQFPVTVKINFYKVKDTIDTFENHINNDSLFSYLLSQLVLSGKTKHILLPVINIDMKFNDINNIISTDVSHDKIYNSIKNNDITDTCCLQIREHFFKSSNMNDYIKENKCSLKNLLFQVIHTLATIQLEYYDFRHNNLLLKNIIVYLKKNSDTYVSYDGFNKDKFYLPNEGFDIKIANFDKSIIFKYHGLFNKTDDDHNNYYDLFTFLNDLINNISDNICDEDTKLFLDEIIPIKMRNKPLKTNLNLFNPIDLLYHKYFDEYKKKKEIIKEESMINHNYLTGGVLSYLDSDNNSVLGDQNKISNNIMDNKVNKRILKKDVYQKGGFEDNKQEKNDSVGYKPERNNPFLTNEQRDINKKRTFENPIKEPPVLIEQKIYDTSKREPPKSQFPPTFVPIYDQTGTATQVVASPDGYPYSQVMNQPPVQKVYNISLSNPVGNYTSINRIYEDVLPGGQFDFSSLTIYERKQLVEFMRNSMIESIDGEEMSMTGGSKSLLQYIKFMNVNPYTTDKNPFTNLPKNFLLYRAAYPVRYNEKNSSIGLGKPATGINTRIYMMTNGDLKCNVIPSIKVTVPTNNEPGLNPEHFDLWREIKYYDIIKTVLKRKISPNFISPILYKTDSKSKIDWKQFEKIKGSGGDSRQVTNKLISNMKEINKSHNIAKDLGPYALLLPNMRSTNITVAQPVVQPVAQQLLEEKREKEDYTQDSGKLLILLTEAPNSSIIQWCTRIYEPHGTVRKMISTGHHTTAVWKSILFQLVYCCSVLQKMKIHMNTLSLEKNFFIKDINSDPNAVGSWIYRANKIDYYVPNYGYILMFDSSYADIDTLLPLSLIGNNTPVNNTNNKQYKINIEGQFTENNNIGNYNDMIYGQFKEIINPDNFGRKLQLNNGTVPDDDVRQLITNLYNSASTNSDISELLPIYFTEFLHNRCGTLLTITEKANVGPMVRPKLDRGNLIIVQERFDVYKWCVYIKHNTTNNKHEIITSNSTGALINIEVFRNALFGYPENEKVQPTNKKNMRYDENYIYESYSLDN